MHRSYTIRSVSGRMKWEAIIITTGSTYRVEPMNDIRLEINVYG